MALIVFILSLSFVNLLFITSVLKGILETMDEQVVHNLTAHFVVEPQEDPVRKDYIARTRELRNSLERIPGVVATSRHYKIGGTIGFDKDKNGRFKFVSGDIIGIDPQEEPSVTGIARSLVAGSYLDAAGHGEILLGSDLAGGYGGDEMQSLGGVKVGRKVRIAYGNGAVRTYTVKGIFKTRFGMIDILPFISIKDAESVLAVHDNASQILVKTDSRRPADYYADRIAAVAPRLKVRPWAYFMGALAGISQSFDMIAAVIGVIGLVVAAITIFIIIYINALNKRRQIGVLSAIGIDRSSIIISFVIQAFFFASCGIAIGAALIYGLVLPYFGAHPLDVAAGDVRPSVQSKLLVFAITSFLSAGIVAGFLPAWRVAKTNLLKAIWGN
jgi:putative ABC transport system permease protein